VHALRLGINVSLGARQAVRAVGAALGLEAPRTNALARQVPLLSSPGAIEQIMTHGPEFGVSDAPHAEPAKTILSVAAKLEGLPHRQGAHPSAYTFSFFARSVLDWLPAQWVGVDRPRRGRTFGAARHLAVVAQERASSPALAHLGSVPPPPAGSGGVRRRRGRRGPRGCSAGRTVARRRAGASLPIRQA
jgi:hypothetical protein